MNSIIEYIFLAKLYDKEILSFLLTIILSLIKYFINPKVNLIWGLSHGFAHSLPDDSKKGILIYTSYYLLSNTGRKQASNVEVTFNYKPNKIEIWPQRQFHEYENPNGRYIIKFDTISPRETISLNIIGLGIKNPDILSVRCDDSLGRQAPMVINILHPRIFYILFMVLSFIGAMTLIYLFISFII